MTYLNGPRLHFAGRFRADVSTVNNIVTHFRDPDDPAEPGWNPGGSGRWSLVGCKVTRAVYQDGSIAQTIAEDSVIGRALNQVDRAVMVDLDPEQQLASQIWGLRLQLGSGSPAALTGTFKTTAFSDLWPDRVPSASQDAAMTAFYHSVLTGVTWGDPGGSRLLTELQQISDVGLLSIKFNVDGFDQRVHVGRIVGTIGPAHAGEPEHFVRGRHCMGLRAAPVSFFPALIDAQRGKLVADFGNALQATSVGGPLDSSPDLEIGTVTGDQFTPLGTIPVGEGDWYERTAAVCEFPADRTLTADELTTLGSTPIEVHQRIGQLTAAASLEGSDGIHVRAEEFVYRMSANGDANVTLHASRFGLPLPNATIDVRLDPFALGTGDASHSVGEPASGITFPSSVTTDANGTAVLPLHAGSIDRPRDYIDGQVYGISYTVDGLAQDGYVNPWNFISVLVWTDYHAPADPTWKQDVEPILSEYAQVYPVMKDFVDLADYDSVVANKDALDAVFSLPQDSPHYMPVTRDLSPAKRQMILAWLQTTGNAGRPNLDREQAPVAAATGAAPPPVETGGGKTAALERLHRPA